MATRTFDTYTYNVNYKIGTGDELILARDVVIRPATTSILVDNNVVSALNPNYDYTMNTISIAVAPVNGATLLIKRAKIILDTTTLAEETLIYLGTFDLPTFNKRQSLIITDTEIGSSTSHTILVQILNIVGEERIPCKYTLSKLEFASLITENLHIDLEYKQVGTDNYISLGTNITVPSTGIINGIDIGVLPDDTEYILRVYHYELNEEKFFTFTSNIVPTIGLNPIIGKVEWNNRVVLLDAPNIQSRMYPDKTKVAWMFPMDYNTKSFDNILSSLWTSDDYLGNRESYHFEMRTSTDDPAETYVGCYINKDHYIGLPFDYTNSNLPDLGASMNIFFGGLLVETGNPTSRKTIFIKFYIDPAHNGKCKLLNTGTLASDYIGFNFAGNDYAESFSTPSATVSLPANTVKKGKWYTLLLVNDETHTKYMSITDSSNYELALLPINSGAFIGDVASGNNLIAIHRSDVALNLTYTATQGIDDGCLGISINYATYKYNSPGKANSIITQGNYTVPIVAGTNQVISTTVPNVSGYGIAVGYSVIFLKGGTTSNGSITINNYTVNGTSITSSIPSLPFTIDSAVSSVLSGTRTNLSWIKTGDSIASPIGGYFQQDINWAPDSLDNQRVYIGSPISDDMTQASYVVAKLGCVDSVISGSDSWDTPYQYIDPSVMLILGASYQKMPRVRCTNEDTSVVILPTENMAEMKSATVRFLLEGLPIGNTLIEVLSGTDVLSSITRLIKSIGLTPEEADYDIDFYSDFDGAITEFKKRYYVKQKRWGGNMGGGTNGNLVYFNRGQKCMILELHGDNYRGDVSAIAPAGAIGYGLPVDLVENPLNYIPNTELRTSRVGGLILSVDYHPYGMFDCWFKIPKGMLGLAICLWYFHYQEIYNYDKPFKFWTETGVKGYTYADSVKSGYGATWLVVNNEIDMELGSENTPYRTTVNPNTDTSYIWYVPGLSYRQCIGCTQEGENYGTWVIDWEASKATIDAVTETNPQNSASYLRSNQLVWVKIMDTIDEVNYGASVRSCRFNNWMNEQWNDGCGVRGSVAQSALGKSELSVNNRTPLGTIDPKAAQQSARYIEKYYDDGLYHKWSIDWKGDYTALYIDDEPIAISKAFVPFNPMTMLVGCWFPSGNSYDKKVLLGEWGTWSGVHADWEVGLMLVQRIKFKAYTEAEAPTTDMRYDCETYAEDGLREIL